MRGVWRLLGVKRVAGLGGWRQASVAAVDGWRAAGGAGERGGGSGAHEAEAEYSATDEVEAGRG